MINLEAKIKLLAEKKLIGQHLEMTFSRNRTFELWRNFMPIRKEIINNLTADLYSLQVYGPSFDFSKFNPDEPFEKWAAIEVANFNTVPAGMDTFIIPGGLYAVFIHKGAASEGPRTFGYIFGSWLPTSGYSIDCRPHFEILGEKYKNEDPSSEEEIWIPIKQII
jgi:AraC family transcriptional regulator